MHPPEWQCFDRRAARVELIRLVEIGRLRNGRPLYLPEPDLCLIVDDIEECLEVFVADQQRIWDAIMGERNAPFVARELPTSAALLRGAAGAF